MADARDVIIEPIVSEKSYALLERNVYTFRVHPDATKPEIHDAVEEVFNVRVLNVNTLNRKGKRKRNRRSFTFGTRRISVDGRRSVAKSPSLATSCTLAPALRAILPPAPGLSSTLWITVPTGM